jgi:hypothetical protein
MIRFSPTCLCVALFLCAPFVSVNAGVGQKVASMGGVFGRPLVVTPGDHAVITEYEAWFGPRAVTFYGENEANPILQSPDMVGVSGCPKQCGYDSEDPHVIATHVSWLEYLGVDAVTLDDTNDGACIYDTDKFAADYVYETTPGDPSTKTTLDKSTACNVLKPYVVHIGTNNANIYKAWTGLRTPLKAIPALDAADPIAFVPDPYDAFSPHKSALEKEIDFYGGQMAKFPGMSVVYEGKPLMLLFVAVNAAQTLPLIQNFLKEHPALTAKYTFRIWSGYLDSQPQYWAPPSAQTFWSDRHKANPNTPSGPTLIDPAYGFWTQVDRFNTSCATAACKTRNAKLGYATYPFYPTYSMVGRRVESFTAAIATAGAESSWGTPATATRPAFYYPDDSLRWDAHKNYVTLDSFMKLATTLKPTFLFVLQFNEFQKPDEGFDADTSNDIEPADLWGYTALDAVHEALVKYRHALAQCRAYPPRHTVSQPNKGKSDAEPAGAE